MSLNEVKAACRLADIAVQKGRVTEAGYRFVLRRVEQMRDQLEGLDRRLADGQIALLTSSWEMAHDPAFHASESIWDAQMAMNRAFEKSGTLEERIERARTVLREMDGIAQEAPDPSDRPGIHRMMRPVVELIATLEHHLRQEHA